MNPVRDIIVSIALASGLVANAAWALDTSARHADTRFFSEQRFCKHRLHGELFSRTELFFGLSRATGPDIIEAEFQNFINAEVTPRFPDELTLLSGIGNSGTRPEPPSRKDRSS